MIFSPKKEFFIWTYLLKKDTTKNKILISPVLSKILKIWDTRFQLIQIQVHYNKNHFKIFLKKERPQKNEVYVFSCCRYYQRCETSMFDLKNGFVICSLFLYFVDFISFGELYVTYRLAFGLKTLTSKNSLLARTHEDWYRVWLHYQLQFNVEDIHPLIFVAAVSHAHLYKLLLKKSR